MEPVVRSAGRGGESSDVADVAEDFGGQDDSQVVDVSESAAGRGQGASTRSVSPLRDQHNHVNIPGHEGMTVVAHTRVGDNAIEVGSG